MAYGQRVWKRQPLGGSSGDGTSPASTISSAAGPGRGDKHGREQRLGVGVAHIVE